MAPTIRDLIADFNRKLKALGEVNIRIYDLNDPDWHISEIKYDANKDNLYFECDCKE